MKPRINLRLCVGGKESLLPSFENCLISYLKFFEIGKLLIYTTSNLQQEVENFVVGLDLPTIHDVEIRDIGKFYEEYYDKFPKSIKEVLDYSKGRDWYGRNLFYMRIRHVMDYYLVKDSFILSDNDIEIFNNIKPIVDWINSDYILYNADYLDNYYTHHPKIVKSVGGADFFKPLPEFNCGWMCLPKGIKINIEEVFKIIKRDINHGIVEMVAIAIVLIKDKIKTKILPRELMVTLDTKKSEMENKTLAHDGPYGIGRGHILAQKVMK